MEIIFETKDLLVVNKPAGLVVHGDGRTDESTVVDWLLQNYPETKGVGEPMVISVNGKQIEVDRSGIVHRLDRDTSGCLVLAKTQSGFEYLKKQFQDKNMQKTYQAFVYGQPKEGSGTVDAAIGRSPKDFRRWSAQPGARGNKREAITHWKVLNRFEEAGQRYSYIEFKPVTGRTHQIRVHAKYMHHPIVSDSLYAGKLDPALNFDRQALHAYKIAFNDMDGQEIAVTAPWPKDFKKVLDKHNMV